MYEPKSPRTTSHTRRVPSDCCSDPDCGAGLRNNYFDGKRLTPDTFRVEHRYMAERRRLLNRAIHGWGAVYGYKIAVDPPVDERRNPVARRLAIGAGLALDKCGRELVELGRDDIDFGDLIVIDEHGHKIERPETVLGEVAQSPRDQDDLPGRCWLLSVHYAEQDRDPVSVSDPCGCTESDWDHVCETVRYTLRAVRCPDCCKHDDCELTCNCSSHACCHAKPRTYDVKNSKPEEYWRQEVLPGRGGCGCLCDHLTKLAPGGECVTRLTELTESCGRVRVDLKHGVPLACVEIVKVERADCTEWTIGRVVDACAPRRLVKRNDLLFDLVRGCDLTRIIDFGWKRWHRHEADVPFEEFAAAFGPRGQGRRDYITTDFWVLFSRSVRWETLRPDCFTMTLLSTEDEGGWWRSFRVPIIGVDHIVEADDPKDHVRGAKIVVDGTWFEDAIRGSRTVFQHLETRVEIEVRGDFIIDCNGQPVDANAIGRSVVRTGNGTPGGTFMSGFTVAPSKRGRDHNDRHENTDRYQGVAS